jgi:alpha,alpha-trehalose phosphorylase
MIRQSRFPVEPWAVREIGLDLSSLPQTESVFALSNGHIGLRGNLDEGDPNGLPGTYLNSFFELRPLPYAEAGYGYPESGQTIVNVTNGKLIRLLVDDEPLDLRYGDLLHHERIFDLRAGVLRRVLEWATPAGKRIRLRTTRLVSFTQRAIAAIDWEVEALDDTRVVVQSELVTNEELPRQSKDPRVAAALRSPLQAVMHSAEGTRASLLHKTTASGLTMAAAMDHVIAGPDHAVERIESSEYWAKMTYGTALKKGERLRLTKFLAYGWSSQRSVPALVDQVDAALVAVRHTGWEGLVQEQREYLDDYWDGADVHVDGDPALQQAVRFGMYHVLQAGARAERRAIPAKGLTGPGYDGHAFWDTEMFVLPVLTATEPAAAADALAWRYSILPDARERAATLHHSGAAFPWRTIRGQECSAYWPAGTAAFHIDADIAAAVIRQYEWTHDEQFVRDVGLPIVVETARLLDSIGFVDDDGGFHIHGVTGPDEYTAIVDDNIYTNLMAAHNFKHAAAWVKKWPDEAAKLDVTDAEVARWEHASTHRVMPFDDRLDVFQQDLGSTRKEVWDFERTQELGHYPLLLHATYFDIYRKQVVKQADLDLAMHWAGDQFTFEQKAKAFAYYDKLTVRDSSLSACTQAVIAAEVGHLELAHAYALEAALMDLRDLERNTGDGVHVASLAGAWIALVAGFGGLRDYGGALSFRPQLPERIARIAFTVRWRGARLRVTVRPGDTTYLLEDAMNDGSTSVEITHQGTAVTLETGTSQTLPVSRVEPITPEPTQPAGRRPMPVEEIEDAGTGG